MACVGKPPSASPARKWGWCVAGVGRVRRGAPCGVKRSARSMARGVRRTEGRLAQRLVAKQAHPRRLPPQLVDDGRGGHLALLGYGQGAEQRKRARVLHLTLEITNMLPPPLLKGLQQRQNALGSDREPGSGACGAKEIFLQIHCLRSLPPGPAARRRRRP